MSSPCIIRYAQLLTILDVHPCDHKFGMEARMPFSNFVEDMVPLSSCNDLALLFPWAFASMGDSHRFNPIEDGNKRTFWWVWSFDGYMDEHGLVSAEDARSRMGTPTEPSVVKSDFTLDYSTADDALRGENGPSKGSEWSIKIYERSDGTFHPEVQAATQALYSRVLQDYGSRKEFEGGVCL